MRRGLRDKVPRGGKKKDWKQKTTPSMREKKKIWRGGLLLLRHQEGRLSTFATKKNPLKEEKDLSENKRGKKDERREKCATFSGRKKVIRLSRCLPN